MMWGGVGRSGSPTPLSMRSAPRARASRFFLSISAKRYGGSLRRRSAISKVLGDSATLGLLELDDGVLEAADAVDAHLDAVAGQERPDPGRGARGDHVAGEQGHDGGHAGHHIFHGKDEALGVADLAQLAVDPRLDLGGIGIEVGGDARPDGAEGVKSLRASLLVIVLLDVPGREVVEAGVAEHVLARALGRGVPAALANDDGQLAL